MGDFSMCQGAYRFYENILTKPKENCSKYGNKPNILSTKHVDRRSLMENTEGEDKDEEESVNSSCVVVIPPGSDNKQARKIFWLKLALEGLTVALLLMTMLFVWQLTKKNNTDSKDAAGDDSALKELEQFKNGPCPIDLQEIRLPDTLPSPVQRALLHEDVLFNAVQGYSSLVSLTANVLYKGKVVWKRSHGAKTKGASSSNSPDQDTVYRVASVTKLFTALFVFKLLEQGKIGCLDDPLEKYEPNFSVKNPFNSDKITLRQLLSHTSGLPREVPCGESWSYSSFNVCPVNTTYVLNTLRHTRLKSPPGKQPNYSNLGYALLGRVLAGKFSGTSYEFWLEQYVFSPLGMKNTGFNLDWRSSNRATGYRVDGSEALNVDWDWAAPAFQAYSTASDLAKLLTGLFQESKYRLLKPEYLQELFNPVYVYPDGHSIFGSGWEVTNSGSYLMLSKGGVIPGFSAGITIVPQLKLGAVAMVSGREVGPSLAQALVKQLLNPFQGAILRNDLKITTPPSPKPFVGVYKLQSRWISKVIGNITTENGVLHFRQIPGYPRVTLLSYLEPRTFEVLYPSGLKCFVYGMGQNHERVVFDSPNDQGVSEKFAFGPFVFTRIKDNEVTKQRTSESAGTDSFNFQLI